MKIYRHAFSGSGRTVFAMAEGPVEAAILSQAYELRRGHQHKRFKQTVDGEWQGTAPCHPFAWDGNFGSRPAREDRADYENRHYVVRMWRDRNAEKAKRPAAVAAYRVDEPGTVQYCAPPDADPCGCSATGREYTFDDSCRFAWLAANPFLQREWKALWLSRLALPAIDRKVTLSVSEQPDDTQRCRISLGSSKFRLCQLDMESFFNCRAIKWEKISASTYLIRWEDLFRYIGDEALAAANQMSVKLRIA